MCWRTKLQNSLQKPALNECNGKGVEGSGREEVGGEERKWRGSGINIMRGVGKTMRDRDKKGCGREVSGIHVYGSPFSFVSPLFTPFSSLFQWTACPFTLYLSTQTYLQLLAPCVPRLTHRCHRVTNVSQSCFIYTPSPRGGWYLFTLQTPSLIPNLPTGQSPNFSNP